MTFDYNEKDSERLKEKSSIEKTTVKCNLCRSIFPKEYKECPWCKKLNRLEK
jgi:hypothetical protein